MAGVLLSNRLRGASPGSGSGSGRRELDGLAGCFGYGAPIILHQTNDASADAIGSFGTSASVLSSAANVSCNVVAASGFTATSGLATGAAPVPGDNCSFSPMTPVEITGFAINSTPNPVGSIWQANAIARMYETVPNELAFVTCGAGDWIVNQRVCAQGGGSDPLSDLSPNALWTDTYILLVDHTGAYKKTIGHATATPFVTGDIETMVVPGKATLLGSTDRIVILLVWTYYFNSYGNDWNPATSSCNFSSGSGGLWPFYQGPSLARDQVIVTPMYDTRCVYPAIKLRDASGSGSGRRRALYGIARGCGPYKLAKKLRGARVASGSGSGSGRRERAVWGIADCCAPFTGGSGSGSGDGFWDGLFYSIICCPVPIKSLLHASFDNGLAPLGTTPIHFIPSSSPAKWASAGTVLGDDFIPIRPVSTFCGISYYQCSFSCDAAHPSFSSRVRLYDSSRHFLREIDFLNGESGGAATPPTPSCSPLFVQLVIEAAALNITTISCPDFTTILASNYMTVMQ